MHTPTQLQQRLVVPELPKLPEGLDAIVHGWVGRVRRRRSVFECYARLSEEAVRLSDQWRDTSDRHLREALDERRQEVRRRGLIPDELLADSLGLLREAADRRLGLRPFPVQLLGAVGLVRGVLLEMATGEGKTLTASLAAVLAGWTGRPCHLVTVNDYLAARDAEALQPLYQFCGVSVGCVTGPMEPKERVLGYSKDVTYTTSKEVVADFLRDRLRLGAVQDPDQRLIRYLLRPGLSRQEGLVMRGLHTAIIDEADSVLVDEAVTPLLISRPQANAPLREACEIARSIAAELELGRDFEVDERYREIHLRPEAGPSLDRLCEALPGLWRGHARRAELIRQALTAQELFQLGKQYVIQDEKVVIVDEFTGRMMPMRTWRQGLHQAIEAKERLEVTDPSETLARLSFQRYFRLYRQLSGMTGTAWEARGEFWYLYGLPVMPVPTHRPCIRQQYSDVVFGGAEEKWAGIVASVEQVHRGGRPVLVGTRSIEASEMVSEMLKARGLEVHVLNAVRHKEEAQIIAEAGLPGRITIATNMAGRGTDIKLGRGVAEQGGLHVVATERHESSRIDRQLFGRSGRQGDPGSAQAFVCLDDELMRRYLPQAWRSRLEHAVRNGLPSANRVAAGAIRLAQKVAQRQAYRQRRQVMEMDTWIEDALSFGQRY
jgi:preprotein translocase subunit SecA